MENFHKKRYTIKAVRIFLTIVSLFIVFGNSSVDVRGQDIGSIQDQLNQITGQISSLQGDLASNQNQIGSLLSQKNSLQSNLGHIQDLLNQANQKEDQINGLISSLQSLKSQAQDALNKKISLKDTSFLHLYESTQDNTFFDFISSSDAKTFLYKVALNEATVDGQKQDIVNLNSQIQSLKDSLNKEAQEKATQDQQVQQLKSQQVQLQRELASVQYNYTKTNNAVSHDQGQINSLQQQYGELSAQENAILNAKYNTGSGYQYVSSVPANCKSGATPSGNLPGGPGNSYTIAVNGSVKWSGTNGPVVIKPNNVNDVSTVTGSGHTGCFSANLEFRSDTNVNFINQTSMENYIQGIGEMPSDWDIKALDTQAVAARTYALHVKSSGRANSNENSNHYDLDNTTAYQSYVGVQGGSKVQAQLDTLAKVIYYNNSPIDAEYSANNGGYERSNSEVWGSSPYAYLPSQSDNFGTVQYDNFPDPDGMCASYQKGVAGGEFFRPANPATWQGPNGAGTDGVLSMSSFSEIAGIAKELNSGTQAGSIDLNNPGKYASEFQSAVGNYSYANFTFSQGRSANSNMSNSQIFGIVINGNGNTDSLNNIDIYGSSGHISVSQSSLYLAFNLASPGGDYLTSPLWYFVNSGGNVVFYAFGFGHSIGMSQCGAEGRAAGGENYNQILSFYYPNTQITADAQILSTDPSSCSNITGYPGNNGCIRVGVDGYSGSDNIVTEHDNYSIYINGVNVFSGGNGDTIEIKQN